MGRSEWGLVFRSLVLSATSGIACGGRVDPHDAAVTDANVGDTSELRDDASEDGADATLPLVDISECAAGSQMCTWLYDLACVLEKFGIADGGTLSASDLKRITNSHNAQPCEVVNAKVQCGLLCPGGRPPTRVTLRGSQHDPSTTTGFFAESATREAASVLGFAELARTLAFHRAPKPLITWAKRSAREERRHARLMTAEARRRGVAPRTVRAKRSRPPSMYTFARENLLEGCVTEAYAALVLVWLSDHAPSHFRAMFATIAKDEVAHAGLAFEIHAWAIARLGVRERRRLDDAMVRAMTSMMASASVAPSPELASLGLPPVHVARALVERLAGLHASLPPARFSTAGDPSLRTPLPPG